MIVNLSKYSMINMFNYIYDFIPLYLHKSFLPTRTKAWSLFELSSLKN